MSEIKPLNLVSGCNLGVSISEHFRNLWFLIAIKTSESEDSDNSQEFKIPEI